MNITNIEVQKSNKNMCNIFVDYKYSFSLEDIDVYNLKLKSGQEITDAQIEEYKSKYEFSKARDRALRFVSYKMRSQKEVKDKLIKLGYSDEVIQKVIEKLVELKYLDDQAYAKSFINEKLKLKPSGAKVIKYELQKKGIDNKVIEKNLSELDIDEFEMALQLANKKYSNIKLFDDNFKRKVYSFLVRRGFSHNTAMSVVKNIVNKEGNYE